MKTTTLFFAALISTSLFAETTLNIPLIVKKNNKTVTTSEINKQYKLTGEEKLLESISVVNTQDSSDAASGKLSTQDKKLEELSKKLNVELMPIKNSPGQGCYTGKPSEVIEIVQNLAYNDVYASQLGIWGWKYKNETHILDAGDEPQQLEFLNTESKLWRKWKSKNESILVLNYVDSGDNAFEGLIKKCL